MTKRIEDTEQLLSEEIEIFIAHNIKNEKQKASLELQNYERLLSMIIFLKCSCFFSTQLESLQIEMAFKKRRQIESRLEREERERQEIEDLQKNEYVCHLSVVCDLSMSS